MRVAYFDTFSGISGDMALGACINAGVSLDQIIDELKKLPVSGYTIRERTLVRSMISATKIDVVLDGHEHAASSTHLHEHAHPTSESHHHHGRAEAHHPHVHDEKRSYRVIRELIDRSELKPRVKELAQKIFLAIAKAEAKIHNTSVDQVHFHEVGAVDSIVDIVGIAICIDLLGVEKIFSSVIRTGNGGFIQTQHGTMPIPTPATIEILRGYPTELTDVHAELTTPTGAAIIAALSDGLLPSSIQMKIESIGYGAGGREIAELPNLLRLVVATIDTAYDRDEIVTVETNIDDMNPEIYPYVIEQLIGAGAHDAFLIPIIMKKGRPGILLSCMCARSILERIVGVIYRETTTLGVRIQSVERKKAQRDVRIVETSFGPVTMKVVTREGKEYLVPEFEECKRIAKNFSLPLREVYRRFEMERGT